MLGGVPWSRPDCDGQGPRSGAKLLNALGSKLHPDKDEEERNESDRTAGARRRKKDSMPNG
jgi:hypothetical protein